MQNTVRRTLSRLAAKGGFPIGPSVFEISFLANGTESRGYHFPAMVRFLLSLVPVLFCSTLLLAQAWQQFGVRQFGFTFDVPPGFVLTQRSDQGAAFQGENDAFLAVWGARLGNATFPAEVEHRMIVDEKGGWKLTYRRVTPRWASYSGIKSGQIRYVRAIAVCSDRAALFTINYSRSEKVPYDPVVVRMVRSLKAEGC